MKTATGLVACALIAAILAMPCQAEAAAPAGPCDRACLYDLVDGYLDALVKRNPDRLPWASDVQFSENNVMLQVGDGLWGTITGLGKYRLKFADVPAGQVGFFGVVEESGASSAFGLRMKVHDRRIAEVETVVVRLADFAGLGGGDNPFAHPKFEDKPVLLADVPAERRRPRDRMISIADGYFDTLQLNDGQLFTEFTDDCNRVENGVQTTNNRSAALIPAAALGCADQFRKGYYRYDDRLRARRFPLVDEERGLVMAAGFIDHTGRLGTYALTDGSVVKSFIRYPHSFYLLELFKIEDGRIRQVEAVFITVPYHMPSPWDR